MGSSQRYRYSRKGKFGRKTGRHKGTQQLSIPFSTPPSTNITINPAQYQQQYHIKKLDEHGLHIRICKDDNAALQVVTDRNIYRVKQTIEQGNRMTLILQKKKITSIEGYRLIDLSILKTHINNIAVHVSQCPEALSRIAASYNAYEILLEAKRYGMASILLTRCTGCLQTFYFHTSKKVEFGKNNFYDINARSVWGQMVTGGGCSYLNEQAATLDMPGMSRQTFSKIETGIGHIWEECVVEEMLDAGCEERRLAIERGDYDDGIPAITVICDGGWSKRSHKHSYNAAGGVAVIIGAASGRILYMGVRNKNCSKCKKYENLNQDPPEHICYRNWTESSQAMEADIIVEGFLKAERMHGVRFKRMVGDGDSSVHVRIQEHLEQVPIWGCTVKKIECANHITKCLRNRLEQLVADNAHYKGKNKLTKIKRVQLVSCVRSIISYRCRHPSHDKTTTVQLLKHDIMNSHLHVFGIHNNCSDFCKATGSKKENSGDSSSGGVDLVQVSSGNASNNTRTVDEDDDIIQEQQRYWSEGMSAQELCDIKSHIGEHLEIDPSLHRDICIHLSRIAEKADRLLDNSTTNLAECWMNMRMKFDGGKVINRCNRGSWNFRCYGALLRKNMGPNWAPLAWEKATGTRAGRAFHEEYSRRHKHLLQAAVYQKKKDYKVKRWKRKMSALRKNLTKKATLEYGPDAIQESSDMSTEQLAEKILMFYEKEVNVSATIMRHIEEHTREQGLSGYWIDERKKRLTASNFSAIVKRSPSIPVQKLVEKLLYSTFTGTRLTRRGLRLEKFAIQEYIQHQKDHGEEVSVKKMGLFIDPDHPYLGASIDGHVTSSTCGEGIIEIKHVLMTKAMMFQEAATKSKGFCLEMVHGHLRLKKTHPFYFQIQGQLNILHLKWADIIVRRVDPHQLFVQRISQDQQLWTGTMSPKLAAFYNKALLPELAAPRNGKKPGIREPGVWYKAKAPPAEQSSSEIRKQRPRKKHIPSTSSESDTPSLSSVISDSIEEQTIHFVSKHILHEWEDEFGRTEWYSGLVIQLLYGVDGHEDAVYEVVYDSNDSVKYELDYSELMEDYSSGSLKLVDP